MAGSHHLLLAGGAGLPGAPTIGTATLGGSAGTALVPFTAPANDGGAAITSYTATSSPGGITGTLSQAGSGTITVSGLTAGTAYTFTVTATNIVGTGPASAASNSVTIAEPPGSYTHPAGYGAAAYQPAGYPTVTITLRGSESTGGGPRVSPDYNLGATAVLTGATNSGNFIYTPSASVRKTPSAPLGSSYGGGRGGQTPNSKGADGGAACVATGPWGTLVAGGGAGGGFNRGGPPGSGEQSVSPGFTPGNGPVPNNGTIGGDGAATGTYYGGGGGGGGNRGGFGGGRRFGGEAGFSSGFTTNTYASHSGFGYAVISWS